MPPPPPPRPPARGGPPPRPERASFAPCSPPSSPLRAAFGGDLRSGLTAAARAAFNPPVLGTKKRSSLEPRTLRSNQETEKTKHPPNSPLDQPAPYNPASLPEAPYKDEGAWASLLRNRETIAVLLRRQKIFGLVLGLHAHTFACALTQHPP